MATDSNRRINRQNLDNVISFDSKSLEFFCIFSTTIADYSLSAEGSSSLITKHFSLASNAMTSDSVKWTPARQMVCNLQIVSTSY